jgi:predicted dehydrogenase
MKFLVIGCGSIGRRHIRNLQFLQAGEIIAFDILPVKLEEVQRKYGVTVVSELDQAWARNPDVALITTPTSLHIPLALEAAEYGCHLFIEKPLSHTMNGVSELLKAVERRSLITLVGCNMRFHPGIRRVKELVDKRAVGKVIAARVEVGQYLPDWHPWEDYRRMYSARRDLGGGVILDAIHEIDYIRWMLGDVTEVACFADKLSHLEIETEDVAAILLRFANGAIGEIHLDYVQRAYSRSCHIIGEEGNIRWDWNEGLVQWYSAIRKGWEIFENPQGWEPNQMYIDEMAHFLNCLRCRAKPLLDVKQAQQVLRIALAAKQSAFAREFVSLTGGRD